MPEPTVPEGVAPGCGLGLPALDARPPRIARPALPAFAEAAANARALPAAVERFVAQLEAALAAGSLIKLVLSKPRAGESDRVRMSARPVQLKDRACISCVHTHKTRDITTNLDPAELGTLVRERMGGVFGQAQLFTTQEETQLLLSRRGKASLRRHPVAGETPARATTHDRQKHRLVDLDRPFLTELGVTTAQHQLVPAMARKWKQINKFVEVLDHALADTALAHAASVRVADFGSGKGYLTFATHEHLRHTLGLSAEVTGVELRQDMVDLCNAAVQRLGLQGLHFAQGDVRHSVPGALDIMIALHACDTATDHAIHTGLRAGASIILCSPCCHKELRPQLLSPHPLRPLLKHGVHLGQQAEMLTDTLRAMLLEACGYDTQVFEFVALEHTNKNKMILAVKRDGNRSDPTVWPQIDALKDFYGVRDQCLETLLRPDHEPLRGPRA